MNIKQIGRTFSGAPETFPVCPKCGSRHIGMNAMIMTCGSCDWYEPINLESPHHTDLSRYKIATSMREQNGERYFHYFLPEDMDNDDRSLAERRLFERCTRVSNTREARDTIARVLALIGSNKDFRAAYEGTGKFPDELWLGVHGRKLDHSDIGAFVQDIGDGLFFRVGSFLHSGDAPVGKLTYGQLVLNVASGASWEILARRRANYSCFIRMEKVKPTTPIFGEELSNSEPPAYRFTVSRYGFYPIHLVMKLDGWDPNSETISVVDGKTCEQMAISSIHIDECDIVGDDVLMQPISWSAFKITGGKDVKGTWAPRYAATLYSSRYLVTCGISEDQDRGQFIARAAVRNVSDGNLVSLKKINGGSIEECIVSAQARNAEIQKLEEKRGEVFIMEKTWDVLDTDPLASLMEIRNLTCWNSEVGHSTMAKRTSTIFS